MAISLELSANYNVKSDNVVVTIYPINGNSYIGEQIASGSVALIYVSTNSLAVTTDVTLATINLTSEYADDEGKFNLIFNHPLRILDLKVSASVVISSVTYSKSVEVLNDNIDLDTIGQNDSLTQYEEFPEESDERDDIVQLPELDPIAVHLDFSLENPIIKGTGDLSYYGGGNRYLPNAYGNIVEQVADDAPWLTRCATYCEEAATNLLQNNDFSGNTGGIPIGYSAPDTDVLLTMNVTGDEYIDSNVWELRYRLGHWTSSTISCDPVDVDIAKPLTVAMFLGIYPQLSDSFINSKNLTLKINFYNNSLTLLGSKNLNYPIANLLNSMYIVNNTAATGDYPTGTSKASFEIVMGSVIQGDDFKLKILLPQMVQQNYVTSFIRNDNTRESDIISIPQYGNVNLDSGGFIIRYIPDYTGYPDSDRCLFDTRGSTGQNGFTCSHRVDGTVNFTIYGQSGTYGLTSSAQAMSSEETEIKVIYDLGESGVTGGNLATRKIYKDKVQIATSSDEFTSPESIEQDVLIGSKYDFTNIIGGQITEFIVLRKFN